MAGKLSYEDELRATIVALTTPGKGILAADESVGTAGKRLASIGVANTEDNRRRLRELLFTAPKIGDYISGVILFRETLFQTVNGAAGRTFVRILSEAGIVPGIKVDEGLDVLDSTTGETTTKGLDGLAARCAEYYAAGARFAKWRAVFTIKEGCPTRLGIEENARVLARYAAVCQTCGLVPIVEPEVLADGDHTIERCAEVTEEVLHCVYNALWHNKVNTEMTILKPNMVTPGLASPKTNASEIAGRTVAVLQRCVPVSVPAILFLSGGQSEEDAIQNLAEINRMHGKKPWYLSFSFGRALQSSALKAWAGDSKNVHIAQQTFLKTAAESGRATTPGTN